MRRWWWAGALFLLGCPTQEFYLQRSDVPWEANHVARLAVPAFEAPALSWGAADDARKRIIEALGKGTVEIQAGSGKADAVLHGAIAGYDARQGASYAWLAQGLVATVALFGWNELAERIRTGDIAVDLARPVDLQVSWLAGDLGRAAFMLLPRGLPPVLIGVLFFDVGVSPHPALYALAPVSIALAVAP